MIRTIVSGEPDGLEERTVGVPEEPDVAAVGESGESPNGASVPGFQRVKRLLRLAAEPRHEETTVRHVRQRLAAVLADGAVRQFRLRSEYVGQWIASSGAGSLRDFARSESRLGAGFLAFDPGRRRRRRRRRYKPTRTNT